jgi:prophage regulatory protein
MLQTILRFPSVIKETGQSRSSIYRAIDSGLWPHPVKLGARSVGWPESEVAALIAARIAGKSDDEIRALVQKLTAQRAQVGEAA